MTLITSFRSVNLTGDLSFGNHTLRELRAVDEIILHRNSLGRTAWQVADRFKSDPKVSPITGGKMPYHFVIEPDGKVCQCLALEIKAPHAYPHNSRSVGISCIGDFRIHSPNERQFWAASVLAAQLTLRFLEYNAVGDLMPSTNGHGEVVDDRDCPGRYWDMGLFRSEVCDHIKDGRSICVDFVEAALETLG